MDLSDILEQMALNAADVDQGPSQETIARWVLGDGTRGERGTGVSDKVAFSFFARFCDCSMFARGFAVAAVGCTLYDLVFALCLFFTR